MVGVSTGLLPLPRIHSSFGRRLWRWLLLMCVVAGIVGMHVLTGGDMASHGEPPSTAHHLSMTSDEHVLPSRSEHPDVTTGTAVGGSMSATTDRSAGSDGMGTCILFLTVGGAALLLALLMVRRLRLGDRIAIPVGVRADGPMRRGPPGPNLPRLVLCVHRI